MNWTLKEHWPKTPSLTSTKGNFQLALPNTKEGKPVLSTTGLHKNKGSLEQKKN